MKKKVYFACIAALLAIASARAEPEPQPQAQSQPDNTQLDNIRRAISETEKRLADRQAAHRRAQQALARAKAELEAARRELARLTRRQEATWQKLKNLQAELTRLQADITSTKAQIARLLSGNYRNRQPSAVILFLKNADANQKSRFLTYTRHINRANEQVIRRLAQQQAQLAQQQAAVNEELAKLQRLTEEQEQKMQRLGQSNSRALEGSRELNQEIAEHRERLARLRREEQGLNNVIAGIRNRQNRQPPSTPSDTAQGNLTREDKQLRSNESPAAETHANVGGQQGRLPMPVSGRVAGSYGGQRETGGTWRGLFIATQPAPVHSIAAGRVSYAASLPGYGNTVIIDHGDGYMSVYTGLSQVAVGNGSRVSARQSIGTSGTLPAGEQGLYFELRYHNQTINPRSWVR